MKRKKYLACLLAISMMLASVSPMAVSADAQDVQADITFEDELDTEGLDVSVDEDTVEASADEDTDENLSEYNNVDADLFSSGEDFTEDVGDSDVNEGWTPLTTLINENRILYKYDENEKTLYFKCTEPIAIPDYNYGNRTDWFVDLGVDKIAQVKKIVIGEGITGIGNFCFQSKTTADAYANLEEVVLADTVTTIGRSAFSADTALKIINLNKVESVGMAAFSKCALTNVLFEKPEVEIGVNAFISCSSLESVTAKKIGSIGYSAFEKCASLKKFTYEGDMESIPKKLFYGTALEAFNFGNVKEIGLMAFRNCGLKYGCYSGTRSEWKELVGDDEDYAGTLIHCKGEAVAPKDATCETDGLKSVGTCGVCGEEYSYDDESNKLPALGHDFVSKVTKKATCTTDGTLTYTCSRCNETKTETIKATGHKWSTWKRTTTATVFKPEVQTRKCSICNKSETRNVGKKLAPKATLNASTVTLKVKQSTSGLKVTGLAKGDSVKSWKSSNSKIFTVSGKSNGTCKITGKKSGTAKLQITLASGLKKTVKVKVQTAAVKTSKITVSKNVTVQKGKRVTLKPVVTPFTSSQKVTYTSSNKKIATVSSKGVVTGKKKGTVKITVKSGSKSVKVTVKVK